MRQIIGGCLRFNTFVTPFCLYCLLFVNLAFAGTDNERKQEIAQRIGDISVPWVKNDGQWSEDVRFGATTIAGQVFVTDKNLTYAINNFHQIAGDKEEDRSNAYNSSEIKESFVGGSLSPRGHELSDVKVNYLIGDKANWLSNIEAYRELNLGQVWPGIEVSLKARGKNIEKIFQIKAGSNASSETIRLEVTGAQSLSVNEEGQLVLKSDIGDLSLTKPIAWQVIDGIKHEVAIEYGVSEMTYCFRIGEYDPNFDLWIDPLIASTFVDGAGANINGIALDTSGNIYIAGGYYGDAYIGKFNSSLTTLLASTYFGGSYADYCMGIKLDTSGNVYISGLTHSNNLPMVGTPYDSSFNGPNSDDEDVFVAKLNSTLTTVSASTYLGGSARESNRGITIDNSGNIYVVGGTASSGFPRTGGVYDSTFSTSEGYISKFNSSLSSLLASTFIGGTAGDTIVDILLDTGGNVYVTGTTSSNDFATTAGAYDRTYSGSQSIFISRLNSTLTSLSASTYVDNADANALATDTSGNIYVAGYQYATGGFPIVGGYDSTPDAGYGDVVIAKLNGTLTSLLASTYLGGSNYELNPDITVDSGGNVIISARSYSTDFPIVSSSYYRISSGGYDFVLAKLNSSLSSLLASTFLGGSSDEYVGSFCIYSFSPGCQQYALAPIILDSSGNIIIAGSTNSSNYPVTAGVYDNTYTSGDAVISILDNGLSDTTPPAAPVITSPTTGTSTSDNTPTISGTSEASATITVYRNGTSQGTTTANGSGNWSFTPGSAWPDGTYSIKATATDAASNASADSNIVSLTIDTGVPVAPVITSPTNGSSTNDNTPTISGTSEASATITVYRNGTSQGTTAANGSGNWSFTPGSTWADGTYSIKATATDAANNTSPDSNIVSLTIDTGVPAAPVITSPTTGSTTNDNTPTISGTSESNATITVYRNAVSQGTTTANGSGNWSFTPGSTWVDGTYSIKATAKDAANNTSADSNIVSLTIDTAAPAAPVITSPTTGSSTNDNTPTINGTSEANATITVYRNGTSQGTTTANGSGNWSFTPGSAWPDGIYSIKAAATDGANNTSGDSNVVSLTIDTGVPSAPVITSPTNGSSTNDNTPTITGTSEANATITVYRNGTSQGTTAANGSGNWSFTPGSTWADGTYSIKATATDAASNTSGDSNVVTMTIETGAPAAPIITSPISGSVTNNNKPIILGTAEPNATLRLYLSGALYATMTVDNDGNWSYIPGTAWPDGIYSIKSTVTDAALNTSVDSNIVTITVDTTSPEAPIITSPLTGYITENNKPNIIGTSQAAVTITIYREGTGQGTTTATGSGTWSFTPSSSWAEGNYNVKAKATDSAGNISADSNIINLTIKTASSDSDDDGLTDTEEEEIGTDPENPNTDTDPVDDGQEDTDGTDPLDRGSFVQVLDTHLCAEWNGFLNMWNIMENLNMADDKLSITANLYSILGKLQSTTKFGILPGTEFDLLVHDMQGHIPDSYGKVCITATGANPGDLDGRMVHYKPNFDAQGGVTGYQFAFAMPLSNGLTGRQVVPYNTYQPSLYTPDAGNLVANWIQITNLENTLQEGILVFYGIDGTEITRTSVRLGKSARYDFSGHDTVGRSRVGIVEWRPNYNTARFQLRNVRYLMQADGINYDSAFQLEGGIGSGRSLSVPLDTRAGSSILELANALAEPITVDVSIYGSAGGEPLYAKRHKLKAHQTEHIITDQILLNTEGIALIKGSKKESVIATAMQYGRNTNLGIEFLYGIQAKEAIGTVLRGTYNTFLNQRCSLLITNPTSASTSVSISMTRYDSHQALTGHTESIPAHGLLDFNLCSYDDPNVYGVVTIQPNKPNTVFPIVLRLGANDEYRFPTPVR